MRPVVVFDTNILISGAVWQGVPYHCLELGRMEKIRSVTCQEILGEFREKMIGKLKRTDRWLNETLLDFLEFMEVVQIPHVLHVVATDPDDDVIVECAVVAKADFIVTGDRHLLEIANYQGIAIISARRLLDQFS